MVAVDTDHEGCFDEDVVELHERRLRDNEEKGVRIRAVLTVNPHNPLGQCMYD